MSISKPMHRQLRNAAKRTLKPISKEGADDSPFILLCDNLEGQISDDFGEEISSQGGTRVLGLKNATDIWQPVGSGYAMLLKRLINQAFFRWLDDDDNCQKWYGVESKFQAEEKRILITNWVGTSYEISGGTVGL